MSARGASRTRRVRPAPATATRATAAGSTRVETTADLAAVARLAAGVNDRPADILGPHLVGAKAAKRLAIRNFLPRARAVTLLQGRKQTPMPRVHPSGLFEVVLPPETKPVYRFEVAWVDGSRTVEEDPYRFASGLGELELHLWREGKLDRADTLLGAHVVRRDGVRGTVFTVWAPHAVRASVIGDFNRWDERRHPMQRHGDSGIWELFLPGVGPGDLYKFHLKTRYQGKNAVKADPYGYAMEQRPQTASVVHAHGTYRWKDATWMAARATRHAADAPIAIYEVHLGSWKRRTEDGSRWLTYRELAAELIPYVKSMGYTHLEVMPVTEHPFDGSWGYQTTGYFAATSRFGSPDDFKSFVDRAHRAGLGVILDWVPAHFPRDGHGLAFFDGTHLYEHGDPKRGYHPDWETYIFDYGRPEVRSFLIASALFWLDVYHLDGLRFDAVASMLYLNYSRQPGEWEPNVEGGNENLEAVEFVRRCNERVHAAFPDALTFAEESTSWPGVSRPVAQGGLGFDLKWNMGWMHDTLSYMKQDPLYRSGSHENLTFPLVYAFKENFLLPLSHDEVVHGKRSLLMKMPGEREQKFANLRALFGWQYASAGKKLLFMGGEFGQVREWNHDRQLDWDLLDEPDHLGLQRWVRDLNRLYARTPALHGRDFDAGGFEWLDCEDANRSLVALVRRSATATDFLLVIANFTPVPRPDYRVGAPVPGRYRVLLNADAAVYGGTGQRMPASIPTQSIACHGQAQSLVVPLPPLAVLFLAIVPTTRRRVSA